MTRVLVATRSRGKLAEFRELLAAPGIVVLSPDEIGLAPDPGEEDLEAFDTFEANARAKAAHFAARSGLPVIADDSGLEVDSLGGAPGVWSKRFAGVDGPDHEVTAANNAELLRLLGEVPEGARGAGYRCVVILRWPDGREVVTEGTTRGQILWAPRGTGGFGYDPLFWSEELGMTFAEAPASEKHRVSHRGRAVARLRAVWPWG
jgi:XTP/dITP diphosphohydrolase